MHIVIVRNASIGIAFGSPMSMKSQRTTSKQKEEEKHDAA
ncbi:hypothetical protein Krac_11646 [Ktedonobacter racemifer DSM 44963]|uniref:Uncharacterized protein n=1 Tax=Ktedonobacter racemifer DSM 44963 TaxID=485913 RepID=D6TCZ8_KTERA|nr:hypothetical protein Krac_11646 [Ktedonobacter racemifer DSM 44963]